jgi:serine/threonine protein kinase
MDKEIWKKIDGLVAEALELPESEREEFVSAKSSGDEDLKKQVLALLEAEKKAANFMDNSAINLMARAIADDSTTVFSDSLFNKKLGSYTIKSLIGAGGMGEVYLAFDEKLNRNVALKVLPKQFHANDERVKRFQTEAKAIAHLNHPNIVTIYDFGKDEGVNYIATEFVEGKTLRSLIEEKLTLKKSFSVVLQILNALSSAHDAGIIHRDIKPENIMVREDGYVKILDFGLAKLTQPEMFESGIFANTLDNVVIGTPAYMSPEQASGEKVDQRTDLWSTGLIFYEMLTGKNPFKRHNHHETIKAILADPTPLLTVSNPDISPIIEPIIEKALEKDADLSYQTASDFRADIKRVKREFDSSPSWGTNSFNGRKTSEIEKKQRAFPFFLGGLILLLTGFGIWYFFFQTEKIEGEKWENAKVIQLTEQAGKEYFPTLSPDGKTFVYASDENGNFDIFSRRVGSKTSINLTPNSEADDNLPIFSPDGNLIAFRSEREPSGIYIMEVTGENPRRVTDFGYHPSWSPDGEHLAVSTRQFERPEVRVSSSIWIVDAKNGKKRKLIGGYSNQPTWSPNGKRIAYWFIGNGGKRDLATISVTGGEPTFITNSANTNWNPVWSPDGNYLYYSSDKSGNMAFWRIRIDQTTGSILDEAEIVSTPAKFNSHLSFSKDGKKMVYTQTDIQSNIRAIEFDEKNSEVKGEAFDITAGDYEFSRPSLSPNNEKFAIVQKKLTQDDIIVLGREGKNRLDLTDDKYFDRYPRWSPDGKKIAFTSDRGGTYDVWLMNNDGTNLVQLTSGDTATFPFWSPDGKRLAYTIKNQTHIVELDRNFQVQRSENLPETDEKRSFIAWDWSPDGKKLAGIYHTQNGWSGVGFYSFETKTFEKLDEVIGFPFWLSGSSQVIYSDDNKIFLADINSKEKKEVFSNPDKNIMQASISQDGKLLYFISSTSESNIWLLDNSQVK